MHETKVLEFRVDADWWQFEPRRKFVWRAWHSLDRTPVPDLRFGDLEHFELLDPALAKSFLSQSAYDPVGVWKKDKGCGWERQYEMEDEPKLERWLTQLRRRAGEGRDLAKEEQERGEKQTATDAAMRQEEAAWDGDEESEEFQAEYNRMMKEEQAAWFDGEEEDLERMRGVGDEDTWAEGEQITAREGYSSEEDSDCDAEGDE
ncbi:hypothetical protein BJ508DRAFT_302699 [Ascobolus immersus RN42]|uniref:Uncharacterized protein n=1 Tax=Ascobolus immersus RN42 TaxID=1160509 RepID=A0A3N4IMK6_ASCIM|nr:hypothetical protein BJ508DRAFT_302699 [Ascobolus immersus RN42]